MSYNDDLDIAVLAAVKCGHRSAHAITAACDGILTAMGYGRIRRARAVDQSLRRLLKDGCISCEVGAERVCWRAKDRR